jgi:DNA-binding response OmpR family regulator
MTDGKQTTVLVVDDERAILVLLKVALGSEKFHVIMAPNATEALAAAQQTPPDLLITDVSMPGLNGYELARLLRADLRQMKILFISGYPISEETQADLPDNSTYLQKPFRLEALLAAIYSLIGNDAPMGARPESARSAASAAA